MYLYSSRVSAIISRPLFTGMVMSVMTMSGRSSAIFSSPPAPFSASATTLHPYSSHGTE